MEASGKLYATTTSQGKDCLIGRCVGSQNRRGRGDENRTR